MTRAVFFDFDGTLYDRGAAILRMADEQFSTGIVDMGRLGKAHGEELAIGRIIDISVFD